MDISFGHDNANNYMIIKRPCHAAGYKLKMLEKNIISGLLDIKYTIIDGEIHIKYNISSKIAIKDLYGREKIKIHQLKIIVQGIIDIAENLDNYLLDVDNIVLTYEMIYFDVNKEKVYLCYNPYYEKSFYVSFGAIVQEFLHAIDYNDSLAVELIYKINEWCSMGYNQIDKLKDIVENSNYSTMNSKENIDCKNISFINEDTDAGQNCNEYNKSIPRKEKYIVPFWEIVKRKFGGFKTEVQEGIEPYDSCYINKSEDETILLSEALLNKKRSLVSMSELDNIIVEEYPFIIGKLEKNSDGVIKHSSISRIQAKIDYNDTKYFIEDLNSKNGTYVNEERIEPYEITEIKIGDIIGFAEINFIFR